MKLKEFVEKFVCKNSLIRLWTPAKDGYNIIHRDEDDDDDCVCMEWQLISDIVWQSRYNDCEVIGVKDILLDDSYIEAINIVIKCAYYSCYEP